MKIEVGKTYKTLCGLRVKITERLKGLPTCFTGHALSDPNDALYWTENGEYAKAICANHPLDIVEEIKDEVKQEEEPNMKIEVGKFYKTRDGRKVRIYAVDGSAHTRIHGAMLVNNEWIFCHWSSDGYRTNLGDPNNDIVSEWEEPKPKLKAYSKDDGTVFMSERDDLESLDDDIPCRRLPWLDEPEEKE